MARDIAQEIIDAVSGGAADYVITKLVKEREEKISSENLAGSVPTTEQILKTAYAKAGGSSGYSSSGGRGYSGAGSTESGGSSAEAAPESTNPVKEKNIGSVQSIDPNGIVTVSGYDPSAYIPQTGSSSGSSSSSGKVAGFFVLGLVAVVILDKLIG